MVEPEVVVRIRGLGAVGWGRWPGRSTTWRTSAITLLLLAYPARRHGLACLASALTISKLALYLAALVIAVIGAWRGRRPLVSRQTPRRAGRPRRSLEAVGSAAPTRRPVDRTDR